MNQLHKINAMQCHYFRITVIVLLSTLLASCGPQAPVFTPTPEASATPIPPTAIPTEIPTATPTLEPSPTPTPTEIPIELPVRAALYWPFSMEDWADAKDTPTLGKYDSSDPKIIEKQIVLMQKGSIDAGIVPWETSESLLDQQFNTLMNVSKDSGFHWSVLYQAEMTGDPTAGQIQQDLLYLQENYFNKREYLRLNERPIIFVDVERLDDGCGMTSRWAEANKMNVFLVMQTFPEYDTCSHQPDAWMNLSGGLAGTPPTATYTIRNYRWTGGDYAGMQITFNQWANSVIEMSSTDLLFQIIDSYNNWMAGSQIEPAVEWGEAKTFFLDILATNGENASDLMAGALLGGGDPILVGAGDIAVCGSPGTEATANLLDTIPGTVFTLGDNSNEEGTASQFATCFDPTWGRHKSRIYPTLGNHDYMTPGAMGYFNYFGDRAGDPTKGYYSYDLGKWHIVVLNSICYEIGGCEADSEQVKWLAEDLAAHENKCTLAMFHIPMFSSGSHGYNAELRPFWDTLYQYGADVVLNGHDHIYERFAPQDPLGNKDELMGIRQFIVGTGGAGVRPIKEIADNSEKRILYTYGVLKLTLREDSYDWEFVPQAGMAATDSGTGQCH